MTHFKTVYLVKLGGVLPGRCSWCGARATHLLTRVDANENTYENNVCDAHAGEWELYCQGVQLEMEML